MSKGLRLFVVSLVGMVFAVGGTGTAFAATITDLQITGATYNPKTDVVTVSAVVTCSETMNLEVFGVIYQGRPDRLTEYVGGVDVLTCSTTPTTFTVENTALSDRRFHPGLAHINVFAESIADRTTNLGDSEDLRIKVARP